MQHSDQIIQRLQNTIFDSDADYTAETIATALIQHGFSPDCIFLQSMGIAKRPHRKDVSSFQLVPSDDDRDALYLHSNRDGLYDALPELIFHSSLSKGRSLHKQEMMKEMRLHDEEETAARKFFLPYEQSFQEVRRALYGLEEHFGSVGTDCPLSQLFVSEWPILQRFDSQKGSLFVRMIPLLHAIRYDNAAVANCLSLLLDAEIHIKAAAHVVSMETATTSPLGLALLGRDCVLGVFIPDAEDHLLLEVTLQDVHATLDFVPGGNKHGLMEELCDYFFNAQTMVSIVFCQTQDEHGFVADGAVALGMGMRL